MQHMKFKETKRCSRHDGFDKVFVDLCPCTTDEVPTLDPQKRVRPEFMAAAERGQAMLPEWFHALLLSRS